MDSYDNKNKENKQIIVCKELGFNIYINIKKTENDKKQMSL